MVSWLPDLHRDTFASVGAATFFDEVETRAHAYVEPYQNNADCVILRTSENLHSRIYTMLFHLQMLSKMLSVTSLLVQLNATTCMPTYRNFWSMHDAAAALCWHQAAFSSCAMH